MAASVAMVIAMIKRKKLCRTSFIEITAKILMEGPRIGAAISNVGDEDDPALVNGSQSHHPCLLQQKFWCHYLLPLYFLMA